jgi:dipeptidyl-peptidase-3
MEEKPGEYNFDIKNPPISPITGKPVTTWYKPGETWGSVFKSIAASYEECRAECVAMYLCVLKEVLEIFGHVGQEGDDIVYASYLTMAKAGLMGLEFYGLRFNYCNSNNPF